MIHVIASVRVKPGRRSDYLKIFKANIPNVKAEKGCIEYRPAVDIETGIPTQVLNADMVTIIEKWENMDALREHLGSPQFLAYREKVKDIITDVALKVLEDA